MEPREEVRRVSPVNALAVSFDTTPTGEIPLVPTARAFVDFYRHERSAVARALALTLGDQQLADEATDEAMTRAYQHWAKVAHLDNPGGWVYRVGLNWSRSVLRRIRRPDRTPPAAAVVAAPEMAEPAILEALRHLSVEHRAVVVCRHLLGWTEQETASVLGLRPGTVKSRLSRALSLLREQLHHLGPEASR